MDLPETLCLTVSVGFEYESCLDLILWEKRTAILQGYELDASNVGGWTLDKHHILDVQNGRLYIIFSVTELDTAICDNTAIISTLQKKTVLLILMLFMQALVKRVGKSFVGIWSR